MNQTAEQSVTLVQGFLAQPDTDQIKALLTGGDVGRRLTLDALKDTQLPSCLKDQFPGYRPVRLVAFAKSPSRSWALPWHQDRVIAVRDRADVAGFGNWTRKSGIWHCEPPLAFLERMVFLRLFLDDVTPKDGGMVYAVGSHAEGVVDQSRAKDVANRYTTQVEEARAGDLLALPMLTLHRSNSAASAQVRRVLRIDLADAALPAPLDWAG